MIGDQGDPSTHASLIQRARHSDNENAWSEFVQRYGPTILRWCRRWCHQDADTYDLSQDILLRVWTKLPGFKYDPGGSFRAWLRTLAHNIFLDSLRRRRGELVQDSAVQAEIEKQSLGFAKSIEEAFDLELLSLAFSQVKPLVEATHWEMFELTANFGYDPKDVAAKFGKSVAAVRMNNLRIRTQVTERIRLIEASLDHPDHPRS